MLYIQHPIPINCYEFQQNLTLVWHHPQDSHSFSTDTREGDLLSWSAADFHPNGHPEHLLTL